jgi:predicted dehydrogenase
MTNRQPLRVGVVGAGGIAQMMHLPTLAERPDLFEVAALADVDQEVLAAVGARYGVSRLFSDARSLVAERDLDAVLLCASGSQREVALAALHAGKHVFLEKPLGYGLRESEEIARAAEKSAGTIMIGYHKRYDPAFQRAREAVKAMDDLRYVQVTVLHPDDGAYRRHHELLPLGRRPPPELPETIEEGMKGAVLRGPMVEQVDDIAGPHAPVERRLAGFLCYQSLIHDLNLVRGVLGEPEKVLSWNLWRGGLCQSSVTRFANDVAVNMSWISVPGLRNYEETVRFVGTQSRVTLVFPSPYLRHFPTPLTIERMEGSELVVENHTVSYDEAFRRELVQFHECVTSGIAPETTVADALGDARWIQAMLAARTIG